MNKKLFSLLSLLLAIAMLAGACSKSSTPAPTTEAPAPAATTESPTTMPATAAPTQAPEPTATTQPEPTTAPTQPAGGLENVTWVLQAYQDASGATKTVLQNTRISAFFADKNLSGAAGCNNYFASYELNGSQLKIGPAGATMMFCASPAGVMDQETAYLNALAGVASYRVEAGQLLLLNADGKSILSYIQAPETPAAATEASFFGTTWEVVNYGDGVSTIATPIAGTQLTAIFGNDSQVSGFAGCNTYNAPFQTDGDQIKIGAPASTRKACAEPAGLMNQETAYLGALMRATRFQVSGETLELYNSAGQKLIIYKAEGSVGPTPAVPSSLATPAVAAAPAPGGTTGGSLTLEALKNMQYKSEFTAAGTALLKDGVFTEQAAPGSATQTKVTLMEPVAYGQLPDGQTAAAVVLVTDPGGSGTFYTLELVLDVSGQPVNVASTFLGDRVQINSVSFKDGNIVVDMVTQGPGDAMCCPTQQELRTYAYQNNSLTLVTSEVAGSGTLTGTIWKWVEFQESNDTVTKPQDPSQYTLEFLPGGKVAVKADCNNGTGVYQVNGSSLTISIQSLTLAACSPGSLSQQFIQYLNNVASFTFKDNDLYLALKVDTGIMQFKP